MLYSRNLSKTQQNSNFKLPFQILLKFLDFEFRVQHLAKWIPNVNKYTHSNPTKTLNGVKYWPWWSCNVIPVVFLLLEIWGGDDASVSSVISVMLLIDQIISVIEWTNYELWRKPCHYVILCSQSTNCKKEKGLNRGRRIQRSCNLPLFVSCWHSTVTSF